MENLEAQVSRSSPRSLFSLVLAVPLLCVACGATFPKPTQRLADAQSAERSAMELGATRVPDAKLSLKLAQDQISQAEAAMAEDENERADMLLIRAKLDAEVAIAQAREKGAEDAGQEAVDDSAAQKATNEGQGAVK